MYAQLELINIFMKIRVHITFNQMEDSLSRTSTESGNDGFVMVGNHLEPKLQIIDDGGMKELEEHMSEILSCDDVTKTVRQVDSSGNFCDKYYRDENSVSSECELFNSSH